MKFNYFSIFFWKKSFLLNFLQIFSYLFYRHFYAIVPRLPSVEWFTFDKTRANFFSFFFSILHNETYPNWCSIVHGCPLFFSWREKCANAQMNAKWNWEHCRNTNIWGWRWCWWWLFIYTHVQMLAMKIKSSFNHIVFVTVPMMVTISTWNFFYSPLFILFYCNFIL